MSTQSLHRVQAVLTEIKILGVRCIVLTGALVKGLACLIRLGEQAKISILGSAPGCLSGVTRKKQENSWEM